MPHKHTRKNGVKVFGEQSQVMPIQRDRDNSDDLYKDELKARTKRKWQAPKSNIPGIKTTTPPTQSTPLPS